MSRVRFQLLFGPASMHPYRMGWSLSADAADQATYGADGSAGFERAADDGQPRRRTRVPSDGEPAGEWYGWRLMGANNRELGRSAKSFDSYPLARRAVAYLRRQTDRLIRCTVVDPATGRWSWRLDLDGEAVAVSARWYERDHDSLLGMARFVSLTPEAELDDGVVTLHDRRGAPSRFQIGAMP